MCIHGGCFVDEADRHNLLGAVAVVTILPLYGWDPVQDTATEIRRRRRRVTLM